MGSIRLYLNLRVVQNDFRENVTKNVIQIVLFNILFIVKDFLKILKKMKIYLLL